MSLYEEIKQALNEAIDYEKGVNNGTKVHKRTKLVEPLQNFTALEIKEIRKSANMTQEIFARCIGVSKKSVEAWECGRTKPDGAARRLLGLLRDNPYFAAENGIVFYDI